MVSRIEIEAPGLQPFSYRNNNTNQFQNEHCGFYLEACKNLKRLFVHDSMADELLQNKSSRFPTLEVIKISNCEMTRIKISCQTLKVLTLEACEDLNVVEVDTPILVSLHCKMNKFPFCSFNTPSLQEVELKFVL